MKRTALVFAVCAAASLPALGNTTSVSGKSCIYLAGQSGPIVTAGSVTADYADPGTVPAFVDITGCAGPLAITATGYWSYTRSPDYGPDGVSRFYPTDTDYNAYGISSIDDAPISALIGVFLADSAPDAGVLPANLVYGSDMTQPLLQQAFVIGSSLSNVIVPASATKLYLGLNDGYQWNNNSGSVDVGVCVSQVPAPGAFALTGIGMGVVGWVRKRRLA